MNMIIDQTSVSYLTSKMVLQTDTALFNTTVMHQFFSGLEKKWPLLDYHSGN